MPKADRILANLPPTYRAQGEPSALRALADAYGGELQTAENSLAAVMRAHWLDFADSGEPRVVDLAAIGSLYGLAPRPDETVEEFRDHLRRYVRTMLEGTVTVTGLLRVTAEALGLHIDDQHLDTWWSRPEPELVTVTPRGADAAALVLGVASADRTGHDALPALVEGEVDLRPQVDLRGRELLWVALDGHGAVPADLTSAAADPSRVAPEEIVQAVDAEIGPGLASLVDGRLRLTSSSSGPQARIDIADGPQDAAEAVLGLRPRTYDGADATRATVTGTADLSTPVDLSVERYLRIGIDGTHLAEVDCAAEHPDHPESVDIDDIAHAINAALGIDVASHDGRFLTLTSPTSGHGGYVNVAQPAAQSATSRLLGAVAPFTFGVDQRPASAVGDRDLGLGVDLRDASRLRLAVDGQPAVTVDVSGADPASTTPAEIATAVNEGLQDTVATHDGQHVTLSSPTPGSAGSLVVEEVTGDAAERVLGLRTRSFVGAPPATASLTGTADLSAGVNLSARHLLALSADGGPTVEVELRDGVANIEQATVGEIAAAVNAALGAPAGDPVATDDGAHLILVSRRPGAAGRVTVWPLVRTVRRRFVTRADVTDDADTAVFGFTARRTTGKPATAARIAGTTDLRGGADLAADRWLRLRVGDAAPVEIDCAGPRPRATTPAEITAAVNAAVPGVAVTDGRTVTLVSPQQGADARLVVEAPHSRDALARLGLSAGQTRGRAAAGVRFTGTVDLSGGVDMPADGTLRLSVDGSPAVDVVVGDGTAAASRSLSQLVATVNQALVAPVAASDGSHLLLTSRQTGSASVVDIGVPTTGTDVTEAVLGIAGPRRYQGAEPTAAATTGHSDVTTAVDLTTAGLLRLAVDGGAPVTVDLGSHAADRSAATGSEIATAINAGSDAIASTVPFPGGTALSLRSPTTGLSSRLDIARTGAGNVAPLLFGSAETVATGDLPTPAVLDGEVDLLGPIDLSTRSVVRLAVDDAPPVNIDLSGGAPTATMLAEVVAAIDAVLPGVAQATDQDRLRLTSPTAGPDSALELVPLRRLELQEYPPSDVSVQASVAHGTTVELHNAGAAPAAGSVRLTSSVGVAGPQVADADAGWAVRVDEPVGAGGVLTLDTDSHPVVTATVTENGATRRVAADLLRVSGDPATVLVVRRGRNRWSFLECLAARFDRADFDVDHFAGGACSQPAVFDVSRFGPPEPDSDVPRAVFATAATSPPTASLAVSWQSHQAGRFVVNLPAELDPRFGAVLGEARFGTATPEVHAGVVTEPPTDDDYVVTRVNQRSALVEAELVPAVPIGWSPVTLPFRDPRPLTLGRRDREARLYMSEPGFGGGFLLVKAAEPGIWGNDITVTGRASGPAIYDLEVSYAGGRFEVARRVVAGPPLPTLAEALLEPGPVGVGTAKAAGVGAEVTRDRANDAQQTGTQSGQVPAQEGAP